VTPASGARREGWRARRRAAAALLAGALAAVAPVAAGAEAYPAKPIRFVVAFPPGKLPFDPIKDLAP